MHCWFTENDYICTEKNTKLKKNEKEFIKRRI